MTAALNRHKSCTNFPGPKPHHRETGKVKCGLCGGKCWCKKKGAACLRVKALTLQLDAVPGLKDYVNGNGKVSSGLGV